MEVRQESLWLCSILDGIGMGRWGGEGERVGNDQNILYGNIVSYIHNTSVRSAVKIGSLIGIWFDGKEKKYIFV